MHSPAQGTRVANAAHAPETAREEPQIPQPVHETSPIENHLGGATSRRQNRLHPGLRTQAGSCGVSRQSPASQHHGRIGCRGAARHRRNGDSAMGELMLLPVELDLHGLAHIEPPLIANAEKSALGISPLDAVVGS